MFVPDLNDASILVVDLGSYYLLKLRQPVWQHGIFLPLGSCLSWIILQKLRMCDSTLFMKNVMDLAWFNITYLIAIFFGNQRTNAEDI